MAKRRIFISHSHSNKEIIVWLKNLLEKVFADQVDILATSLENDSTVPFGLDWLSWITDNLSQSDVVLVVLTPDSKHRPWVWFEMGHIWQSIGFEKENSDEKIRLIPVTFNLEKPDLEYPFLQLQTKDLAKKEDVKALFGDLVKYLECGLMKNFPKNSYYQEKIQKDKIINNTPDSSYRSKVLKVLTQLAKAKAISDGNLALFEESDVISNDDLLQLRQTFYGKD
jgi:hypothetical protein